MAEPVPTNFPAAVKERKVERSRSGIHLVRVCVHRRERACVHTCDRTCMYVWFVQRIDPPMYSAIMGMVRPQPGGKVMEARQRHPLTNAHDDAGGQEHGKRRVGGGGSEQRAGGPQSDSSSEDGFPAVSEGQPAAEHLSRDVAPEKRAQDPALSFVLPVLLFGHRYDCKADIRAISITNCPHCVA